MIMKILSFVHGTGISTSMIEIIKIWFTEDCLVGLTKDGRELKQSLLWYPDLLKADEETRNDYTFMQTGIFWNSIDTQISFESFTYPDAMPSRLQAFFLNHPEINVAGFAKKLGLNASLMRSYINGFKTPSADREREILGYIEQLGKGYTSFGA